MARRTNYGAEKRQKEIQKQKKKEEKNEKKRLRREGSAEDGSAPGTDDEIAETEAQREGGDGQAQR